MIFIVKSAGRCCAFVWLERKVNSGISFSPVFVIQLIQAGLFREGIREQCNKNKVATNKEDCARK